MEAQCQQSHPATPTKVFFRGKTDSTPVPSTDWRHFGADYTGKGVDQITNLINTLQTLEKNGVGMVPNTNVPATTLTQRSSEVFLGLPFNIASTAPTLNRSPSRHLRRTHRSLKDQNLWNVQTNNQLHKPEKMKA